MAFSVKSIFSMSDFAVKSGYYTPSVFSAKLTSRSISVNNLGWSNVKKSRLGAAFVPTLNSYSLYCFGFVYTSWAQVVEILSGKKDVARPTI